MIKYPLSLYDAKETLSHAIYSSNFPSCSYYNIGYHDLNEKKAWFWPKAPSDHSRIITRHSHPSEVQYT